MTAPHVSPAVGDFALAERPKLLAEIAELRKIIVQYLAWCDRAPDRECLASIQERMHAAVVSKTGGG